MTTQLDKIVIRLIDYKLVAVPVEFFETEFDLL